MGEQNLAVGYEFYGGIRDTGDQQFVCLFVLFTQTIPTWKLREKIEKAQRPVGLWGHTLEVPVAWRSLHPALGECLGNVVTTFKGL